VSSAATDREVAANPMHRRELISRSLIIATHLRVMSALMLNVEGRVVKPDV
jgi:hypothetical protein